MVEVKTSCIEITNREKAEKPFCNSETPFRVIAEIIVAVVKVFDGNGVFQYACASYKNVFGFSTVEVEGRSIFDFVHPEDIPLVKGILKEMRSSQSPFQFRYRYYHADGHLIYVDAQGTPVIGANGEVEKIIIIARDISEKKEVDGSLRKSDLLSPMVELMVGIAHKIRNPLTSLKGFIQLLRSGIIKPSYFDIMLTEFQSLEEFTEDLLLFAKPQKVHLQQINLYRVLDNAKKLVETYANPSNIKFKYDYELDIPSIYCDESQVKQVFINLLKNAIDAMVDRNGGEIHIKLKRFSVNKVSICILDQGCGITEERIKRLGEPYYSTKEKGIGLGLMVCYKFIEAHQGTIHFESERNKGTKVKVILPINIVESVV